MAKKRKSDACRLDEVDRNIYTTFCGAANFLSQLYTQAMHQQKFSFQAGERHALEKVYSWIMRQQEHGPRLNTSDIMGYLQNELECGADEAPVSPRLPSQQQQVQTAMHLSNSGIPVSCNSFGPSTVVHGHRSCQSDHQAKNSVFLNAFSSFVHLSQQHYHMTHGGHSPNNDMPAGNVLQNTERSCFHQANKESNTHSSNDFSMDMHADSPSHASPYQN